MVLIRVCMLLMKFSYFQKRIEPVPTGAPVGVHVLVAAAHCPHFRIVVVADQFADGIMLVDCRCVGKMMISPVAAFTASFWVAVLPTLPSTRVSTTPRSRNSPTISSCGRWSRRTPPTPPAAPGIVEGQHFRQLLADILLLVVGGDQKVTRGLCRAGQRGD